MSNPILYVGKKEYFKSDVLDDVNKFFTREGIGVLNYVEEKLVFQVTIKDKIEFLEKFLLSTNKTFFDFFNEHKDEITYAINLNRKEIFTTIDTITFVNDFNPLYLKDGSRKITLLGPSTYEIEYPKECYNVIFVESVDEFIKLFNIYSHDLIINLLDFILSEHLLYKLNELRKQYNILHPIEEQSYCRKKLPEYCIIGVMVLVKEEITKKGDYFIYKEKKFDSSTQLEKYLKQNEGITVNSIRQYLDDTFGAGKNKDLKNPKRIKKIFEYCQRQNIKIPDHIQSKYPELNN